MIVRLMGDGQYEVPDDVLDELNRHDDAVETALHAADEAAFRVALDALSSVVRDRGARLPDDSLLPSDVVLPPPAASMQEVADLLGDEGLVPG